MAKAAKPRKTKTDAQNSKEPNALAPGERLRSATGFGDPKVQLRYLNQLVVTLQNFAGETLEDRAQGLLAQLAAIAPRDGVEGMLAAQMVAAHEHAMECFRRAMLSEQSFAGRDLNLKHAAKMLQVYRLHQRRWDRLAVAPSAAPPTLP